MPVMFALLSQVAVAVLATLAFAVLFGAPRRQWVFCGIAGGIAWLANSLLLVLGADIFLASFLATLTLTCFARLFAVLRKAPVTLFLIEGIFPLVPGAGIYYTAYYLFASDFSAALVKGLETVKFAGAITLGILFGFSLPPKLFSWIKKRQAHE